MSEFEVEPGPQPRHSYVAGLARELSLQPGAVAVLEACGVSTPNELVALARAFPALSHFVDVPLITARTMRSLEHRSGLQERSVRRVVPSAFGANYPHASAARKRSRPAPGAPGWRVPMPPRHAARSIIPASLPDVLLDDARWKVRDQGNRGTCVAHAACGKLDWASKGTEQMSPQFLFWAVKNRGHDTSPNDDGTLLKFAAKALASDGVCLEQTHPYSMQELAGDPGHRASPPSPAALAEAGSRTWKATAMRGPAVAIVRSLLAGKVVAVSLPVFVESSSGVSNWETEVAWDYGTVLDAPPTLAAADVGHAVALVGFRRDPQKPGGGVFILRNSWGEDWGARLPDAVHAAPRAGYGSVSVLYVENYAWEIYS